MKKLILIILSISFLFINYSFAQNDLDTSIYEVEKIYNDAISRMEVNLNNAKDSLKRQEEIVAKQINIAIAKAGSSGLQLSAGAYQDIRNDIYKKYSSQLDYYKNIVAEYENNLDSLKNEKQLKILELKIKYQNTNNSNSNSSNKNSCGFNSSLNGNGECVCNSGYIWKDLNDKTNLDCVKKKEETKCGLNSSPTYDGNCRCNSGYVWKDPNDSKNFDCVKEKTPDQLCQESYGDNTIAKLKSNNNGDYTCYCKEGYIPNSNGKGCIKQIIKTPDQLCQESFGKNSIYSGTQNKDGTYNCSCNSGYIWNTNQTSCIVEIKKEEVKIEEKFETYNLPDNLIKKIDTIFEKIKKSKSNLSDDKKIDFYQKLQIQLDSLYTKQKKELNKNIINYLKSLIKIELNNLDDNLGNLFDDLFSE